ncbi:MAG: hypothetical protein WC269_06280 [Candidatus Gracilibacteria bacterium]|jgi:hypothetical protein
MKKNIIVVQIQKAMKVVFDFTTNPINTPLWIDDIEIEESTDWPIKLGTIYKNKNKAGQWFKYKVISLESNKLFELMSEDNNYHVRYTYKKIGKNTTEMEYLEWVERGDIDIPFTQDILDKLKIVIEKK